MNITMKIVMILCLLVLIQCRGKGRGKLRCKPGEKYMSNGKCEDISSGTTGAASATHYDNGLRILQKELEAKLQRDLIIPCYGFDISNGKSCFSKSDKDFDGHTVTTYCEVCEISDRNKVPYQRKECSGPNNCTLRAGFDRCGQDDEETTETAWLFTSYDDNSLCDCGSPFIYHSRVIYPGTRTNKNDFLESENLNDFFARPLEPDEKECLASHGEYKNQPIMCQSRANPYPNGIVWKIYRYFTTIWTLSNITNLPSIPGSECSSRPDISALFSLPLSPYYPEKCDAGWFQVGNVCYKQMKELKSWLEAVQICRENNADLASIADEETQSLVWSEIKYQNPGLLWIGGFTSLLDDEQWYWTYQGNWVTWDNWAPNEPETDRGNCLAMQWSTGGKWGAVNCSERLSFVCSRNLQTIFNSDVSFEGAGKPWCKGRNFPGGRECCEADDPEWNKCTEGQGDCDSDAGCAGSLVCGRDNCRQYHKDASPKDDCCTTA